MNKNIVFKRFILLISFAGLLVFMACNKDEFPNTTVGVQVMDLNNQFISGATVKLYSNLNDFSNDNNVAVTMTTDADGLASTEQKLAGGSYLIWAEKSGQDNWNGEIDTVLVAFTSGTFQIVTVEIGNTFSEALANSVWDLSDVKVDGISVWDTLNVCYKDNFLEIARDYVIVEQEGDTICPGNSPIISSGNINPGYVGQPGQLGYLIPDNFYNGTIYLSADFSEIKVVIEDDGSEIIKVFLPQ